jgi:hypothetical protein
MTQDNQMVDLVKFSTWLGTELPPLPSEQTIPGDQLIVIRAGLPYSYDPKTRFAYADMVSNAAATGITVIDQWESIAGTLVESAFGQGFTLAANIWTVTAETSLEPILMMAGVTAQKVGSGDDTYQFGIFINGILDGAPMSLNTHATKLDNCALSAPLLLATGDTIEIKVRNRDDIANVVITDMFFGIS